MLGLCLLEDDLPGGPDLCVFMRAGARCGRKWDGVKNNISSRVERLVGGLNQDGGEGGRGGGGEGLL